MIKRVRKDIWRDRRRYFLIFTMFVLTIGFISGMFVSNNSMMTSLESCVERFKREEGHFRLSEPADKETIAAIESGEMADVAEIFRERAYEEAEDEVIEAVDDAMAEEIDKAFRKSMTLGLGGWFEFTMPVSGFVKEFLLVFIAYLLITVIDFFRIRKITEGTGTQKYRIALQHTALCGVFF